MVTHDAKIAAYAERIVRFRDGRIESDEAQPWPARIAGAERGMTYLDALRSALEALRANPTRSFLTTLGVIIGVAAVILVVAIGSGARDLVVSRIKSLGSNLLVLEPGAVTAAACICQLPAFT